MDQGEGEKLKGSHLDLSIAEAEYTKGARCETGRAIRLEPSQSQYCCRHPTAIRSEHGPIYYTGKEDHLCVISDLHLGHTSFIQSDKLNSFIEYLSGRDTSLCINGDGIDLLQVSIPKLLDNILSTVNSLHRFSGYGNHRIYYVVGNHDIYMESYLERSGILNVVPFLDVISGEQRIHIEHGYLYDLFAYLLSWIHDTSD